MTLLKKEISEISLRFGAIGFVILASMAAASLMADTASPLKAPIIASVTAAKSPAKVLASGERTRSTTFTVVVEFADLNSGDLMIGSLRLRRLPPKAFLLIWISPAMGKGDND